MLVYADFPSGDPGIYGVAPAANGGTIRTNLLAGAPWINIVVNNSAPLIEDPDPNISGAVFAVDSGNNNNVWVDCATIALPNPDDKITVAGRVLFPAISTGSTGNVIAAVSNQTNTDGYYLKVEINGALSIYRRSGTEQLATTTIPVITTGAWKHYSVSFDYTTGDISVQLEGTEILTATDDTPITGNIFFVQFLDRIGTSGRQIFYIKDLVINDGNGSKNTGHPGPVQVYRRNLIADVSSGWSRTSGSSDYSLLTKNVPNDTAYIYAGEGPIPAPSIMTVEDLPDDVVAIRGIILVSRMAKSDGGEGSVQVSISPNGTDWDDGADRAITSAFTYYRDVSENDPDTGTNWTPASFNGSQLKINRTI